MEWCLQTYDTLILSSLTTIKPVWWKCGVGYVEMPLLLCGPHWKIWRSEIWHQWLGRMASENGEITIFRSYTTTRFHIVVWNVFTRVLLQKGRDNTGDQMLMNTGGDDRGSREANWTRKLKLYCDCVFIYLFIYYAKLKLVLVTQRGI